MYFDLTYVYLVLPAVLFALWASWNVKSTFSKYKNQRNSRHITGAEAAKQMLNANGIYDVRIERVSGSLTDHYDPKDNVIRLSEDVYSSDSVASIGIACHEVGHVLQHAEKYTPILIRNAIIPATNIGSTLAMPLVILGIILSYLSEQLLFIAYIGIICFSLCAVFQLITLPTEFNASRRAVKAIEQNNFLYGDELSATKSVLRAAALTYVAALAVSLMQLIRLLVIVGGRRND